MGFGFRAAHTGFLDVHKVGIVNLPGQRGQAVGGRRVYSNAITSGLGSDGVGGKGWGGWAKNWGACTLASWFGSHFCIVWVQVHTNCEMYIVQSNQ
jgi:hypothetical protein